ncbi:aminoglycoside phosphotransferase family protein [Streptomyces sp. NPDC051214]|uniref:aminoglycoside phosphotransferase family protein n=1 Tax=Streptomyces sp. NPDC051214 TaxID=3155282 RepID=UPI003422085E
MIDKPGAGSGDLIRLVHDAYDLHVLDVDPTAPGADAEAATYRLTAHDGTYFLKLRRGAADDTAAPLQSFLADAVTAGASEAGAGIEAARVIAPLQDRHGRLSTVLDGYVAVLYPFVAGRNGFDVPLTRDQWTALGNFVRALHHIGLPPSLRSAVRVETYGPKWRDKVRGHLATDPPPERLPDAPARELAAILRARRQQLTTLVERAEQLAAVLRGKERELVLCHGDLHAGNVMVTDDGTVVVVDWDDPVMAPRERDLMFVGGGVGGVWNDAAECAAFYRGYGTEDIDAQTLAYYRCERIVQDVAEYCDQLLVGTPREGDDDRELSLRHFAGQFRPDDVVDIAERTYAALRG